ncbi:efflux RND transporter periplasmic adaptor subunit [Marinobacteraceae bacterium S3BR75-40.1]
MDARPSPRTAKHFRPVTVAALIAGLVVLWMLSGLLDTSDQAPMEDQPAADTAPPSVRVLALAPSLIRNQIVVTGRTLADRRVQVKAETDGLVEAVEVDKGDTVTPGQALVQLAVEDREARLAEARALLQQRELEYRAAQSLRDRESVSRTELARAKAALEGARAALESSVEQLERTLIEAPIEGTIEARQVEVGDFVSRGTPVAEIVDLDPMRVRGQLSERFLGQVKPDTRARVRLLDGTELIGTVDFISNVASPTTRTFPVEIIIPNPQGSLIEGLTAEITLFSDQVAAYRIQPSMLSLSDQGMLGVKAVNDDNRVAFYPVALVRDTPEGLWVSGLPDHLQLITVGHEFVSEGQQVKPVPEQTSNTGS